MILDCGRCEDVDLKLVVTPKHCLNLNGNWGHQGKKSNVLKSLAELMKARQLGLFHSMRLPQGVATPAAKCAALSWLSAWQEFITFNTCVRMSAGFA